VQARNDCVECVDWACVVDYVVCKRKALFARGLGIEHTLRHGCIDASPVHQPAQLGFLGRIGRENAIDPGVIRATLD
jgi:hypothetical protein